MLRRSARTISKHGNRLLSLDSAAERPAQDEENGRRAPFSLRAHHRRGCCCVMQWMLPPPSAMPSPGTITTSRTWEDRRETAGGLGVRGRIEPRHDHRPIGQVEVDIGPRHDPAHAVAAAWRHGEFGHPQTPAPGIRGPIQHGTRLGQDGIVGIVRVRGGGQQHMAGRRKAAEVVNVAQGLVVGQPAGQPDHRLDAEAIAQVRLDIGLRKVRIALGIEQALLGRDQRALPVDVDRATFKNLWPDDASRASELQDFPGQTRVARQNLRRPVPSR